MKTLAFYLIFLLFVLGCDETGDRTADKYLGNGNKIIKDDLLAWDRGGEIPFSVYKEAIAEYDKAIEIDPKHLSAYLNRGIAKLNVTKNFFVKKVYILNGILNFYRLKRT